MKIRITTFLFLSFFSISCAFAQENNPTPPKKDVILSTSLTGNAYYGDMNYNSNLFQAQSAPYFSVNPGVNLSIYTDHPRFLRPAYSVGYGRIVGQNSTFQPTYITNSFGDNELVQPTRYIRTDYVYGDVGLRFTPIRKIAQFDPYLYAGVGGFFFRPVKLDVNGDPLAQGGLKSNSYSAVAISFPISAGMDINLGRKVSLNVGTSLRLPMTDFIDNTGSNYSGVYNVQDGNDKILAVNVGANFRIFDSEKLPKFFRFPELFFSEQKKAEPEDTLILASALDISEHPEFLAPKVWQSHDPSAKKMKSVVGELVLTSDCDSLARKYEERVLNLTNENLQLRSEYAKLNQEANKLREDNQNFALKEKVANEKLAELSLKNGDKGYSGVAANRTVDSLMKIVNQLKSQTVEGMAATHENSHERDSLLNVIRQQESAIADLEVKAKSIPVNEGEPVAMKSRKAGEDTEGIELIAVYEKQLDSLKNEMSRLERRYKEASSEADIANAQKETLKERLQTINETKILTSTNSENLDVLVYEKRIDSLNQENERTYAELSRLRTENDAIKKNKYKQAAPDTDCTARIDSMNLVLTNKQEELAILQKQYTALVEDKRKAEPSRQQDLATIQKQVADIMAKVAQLQQERDEARTENERLVAENVKMKKDQQALITQNANQSILILVQRAQQRVDSMNAYFAALQRNIDGYERKINQLRDENDSLQTALQQLNRMVDGGKAVEDVRVAELEKQLKDANTQIAHLDAKLADAKTARIAPANFDEDIKELQDKLAIANDKVQELEDKNTGLIAENNDLRTKGKPSPITPPAKTGNDPEKIAELEAKIKTMQSSKETLTAQLEKLEEENERLKAGGTASDPNPALMAKIEELQKEADKLNEENIALKEKPSAEPTSDVALTEKIKQLSAENEDMIAKVSGLEMDNKQLAGENDLLRKNSTQNAKLMTELENLRPKVETLQKQNTELEQNLVDAKEDNARLVARVSSPNSNNNEDLVAAQEKIKSLEQDNKVLMQQVEVLSADKGKEEIAQVPVLEAKIAALENELKSKPVVNVAAEKLQAENEDLKAKNEELIAKVEDMETDLKAKEISIANLKAKQPSPSDSQPTSPSEEVAAAQAQITALQNQLNQKDKRIEELEANANMPSDNEKLAQLQIDYNKVMADNAVLREQVSLSQPENSKPEALVMSLMAENEKLKAEKDSIINRIKEAVVNSGITTQKVEELANLYKDNEILKGKVASLETELEAAKATTSTANPDAELTTKIASLETANKTLKQQLEDNTAEVSRLLKEKDEWQLKANQLAATDSISKASARVSAPSPELESMKSELATVKAENETLKKQIAEGGDSGAALTALQEKLNESETELERKNKEIADWKLIAEGKSKEEDNEAVAKLTKEVAILTDENRALKDEIAKGQTPATVDNSELEGQITALKSAMSDKDAEVAKLTDDNASLVEANRKLKEEMANAPKPDNSDLESQITSLQLAVADKDAEIERLKAAPKVATIAPANDDLNKLKNENIRLNEENQYLKEELANVKVTDPNISLQSKINELQSVIEQKDQEIADLKTTNPNTNGIANELSSKNSALTSRSNDQEMREKKLNQRENYISLKEEEIHRNEKKYEYLNAKEIELRLSEQRISGFYNRPENMLLDGAPCQYVTAFLEKEEVMNKIDDYFLGMGYNYRLENGKIAYSNIIIPEISNKPMNIAFYMRIADTGKRTLQGVFRFANGTYVNEDKFPAETIKAIKLLQKLAQ